LLAP
jgi:hypothetical protein